MTQAATSERDAAPAREWDVLRLQRAGAFERRMTATEFRALGEAGVLGEDDHVELIGGTIAIGVAMRGNAHEKTKSAVVRWLARHLPDDLEIGIETTITLSSDDVVEPDVVLYPRDIDTADVRGPDIALVVEVADSSLPYDTGEKAAVYAQGGVLDYWVIDTSRHRVIVSSNPVGGLSRTIRMLAAGASLPAPLPGAPEFRLIDLGLPRFGRG